MPEAPLLPSPTVWRIALPVPLPRLFDYLPPAGDAGGDPVGARVRVPFGRRELVGLVAETGAPEPGTDPAALKQVLARLDPEPLLHGELLESLRWLARYTHAPLGEVLATALPGPLRHGEPLPDTHAWAWRLTEAGATARPGLRAGKPRRLSDLLDEHGELDEDRLDDLLEDWRSAARALAKRGHAERVAVPAVAHAPAPQPGPPLNDEQQAAVDSILAAPGFTGLLLDGVTGSGKTEVYLRAIADCLARGKQALVLVPEIGLTPQTLARFRARLGMPVHALHSGLADGERARTWAAFARGEARVAVGTRSAVFLPLAEPGLIVIDEEHDGSFKQLDGIRYHARDFALVRAKALDVPVLLAAPRRRWNRCATPRPAVTATCACCAAPARRSRRGCACSTCASGRCRRVCRRNCSNASTPNCAPAARRWCSRTGAATPRCCCATTAAGPRTARAAAPRSSPPR